ncbi:MAG TPA: hypothetical protein GXZ76_02205 [Clostridiaceae bacterium]|nr:hypothetical protein [Clostridiaceae bacterium]
MKRNRLCIFVTVVLILFGLMSCSSNNSGTPRNTVSRSLAQIFLYGEKHGIDATIEREFEIWHEHYDEDSMRHLFLESPYFTCEFLNVWMQEDNDEILNSLYDDLEGTASHVPAIKDFYKQIKEQCPETIFHGTDVGHQFYSTGERYLEYLEDNLLENTEQYLIAQEVIEQGQHFYETSDDVYRENKMTENFIREFDLLDDEKIMGIYGASHIDPDKMDFTGKVPCMANQLKEHYGDIIYSENLSGK